MNIETEVITGINVGFEFFDDFVFGKGILIDCVFLRFTITWGNN